MARNCQHFTVDDENKLCYTAIHTEFLKMTECYICEQLTLRGINVEVRLFFFFFFYYSNERKLFKYCVIKKQKLTTTIQNLMSSLSDDNIDDRQLDIGSTLDVVVWFLLLLFFF